MGIGAQKKAPVSNQSSSIPPSFTAPEVKKPVPVIVVPKSAADAALPPSYDNSEVAEFEPNVLLLPTGDNDLSYFNAVAAGDTPQRAPSSYGLVMNLFRTTQCHIVPLDERIALGSCPAQPFYSLQSSPSISSMDEFNKLTISRRDPGLARWTNCCISEIQPRLKLLAAGVMIIAKLDVQGNRNRPDELYTMTWEKAKDTYTVWKNTSVSQATALVDITPEEWESLEDVPGEGGGVVRAKSRNSSLGASHHDLAVLDASKPSLQLISTSAEGHSMMDLLVGSLLTVAIVHTRMCKLGRAAMGSSKVKKPDIEINLNITSFHIY